MTKEDPLHSLLSPGPSLEGATEDEHDQEWDSELAESDEGSQSSSSDSDEESSGSRHKEVDQKMLQALKAIQAKYQDEDVVFQEEILSDSEISKEFPEEDDLEVLRELESDAGDDEPPELPGQQEGAEEESGVRDAQDPQRTGPSANATMPPQQQQQQPASSGAAVARQALWESMEVDVAQGRPLQGPAAAQQTQQQHAEATWAAGPADWGGGNGGGDLLAFGAVLGSLEAEDPIARRTRAHHCLNDISLEELEEMLQVDEDLEELNGADNDEYQRFLQSLRDFPDLPSITVEGEDSEDEDFALELAGLLESESDGQKENKERGRKRMRAPGPSKPRVKKPRWTRAAPGSKAAREHRLRPVAPRGATFTFGPGPASIAPASIAFGLAGGALSELALTALHDSKAAVQEVAAGRPFVVWRPPLPGAEGLVARRDAAVGQLQALPGAFTPPQYRQLYRMLHQHVQLLVQVYSMAVGSEGAENSRVARDAAAMLEILGGFRDKQEQSRRQQGIPAYDLDALGLHPSGAGGPSHAGISSSSTSRDTADDWAPPRPPTAIYTVADLALLRKVPGLLQRLPPPPPIPEGEGGVAEGTQAAAAAGGIMAGAGPNSSQGPDSGPRAQQQASEQQQQQQQQAAPGSPSSDGGSQRAGVQQGLEAGAADAQGREDGDGGQQEGYGEAAATRKKRTKRKKPTEHALWQGLSEHAQQAVADVGGLLEPGVKPQVPKFLPSAQMLFTPAEDELLALAMLRHGFDWAAIRRDFFPHKTEKVLFHRKKNRCISSVPDNCIKRAAALMTGPLRPDEIALLEQALSFYGKAPHRWESIVRDHLPYRQPNVLATLWAQHTNGASVLKKKGKQKQGEEQQQEQEQQERPPEAAQGMRQVFLSNEPPAEEQQQQQGGDGRPAQAAAARPAQQQQQQQQQQRGDGGVAGVGVVSGAPSRLLPRIPLGAGSQLQAILQGLFPPGVEVPYPLQLAGAVAAVAAASGTPLPGPLAVVLPQGVPPPPGMIAVGLAEGAVMQHWEMASQLFGGVPPQQQAQGQQGMEQEAAGQGPPDRQPTLSVQTGGVQQAGADPDPRPLTVHSPTQDVATELQRLLNGEGSNPPSLLPSPTRQGASGRGGGSRRKRKSRVGLFQGDGGTGGEGPAGGWDAGAGSGRAAWEEQLYQPIHLPGLPLAPGQAPSAALAGAGMGPAFPGLQGSRRGPPAGDGQVASKGRRVHFEAEELEDSEEEEEGSRGPAGASAAAPQGHLASLLPLPQQPTLPVAPEQMLPILPLFAPVPLAPPAFAPLVRTQPVAQPAQQQQQMLQQLGPEFEAEELTDTDDEAPGRRPSPSGGRLPQGGDGAAPAAEGSAATQTAGGKKRGQRRPAPTKPIRGSKRQAGGRRGGIAAAAAAEPLQQQGLAGVALVQPFALGGVAQAQPIGGSTAAAAAAAIAAGATMEASHQQQQQLAQQPAFEQDYLSDSEDEGPADMGCAPLSPPSWHAASPSAAEPQPLAGEAAGAASMGVPAAGMEAEDPSPAETGGQLREVFGAAASQEQELNEQEGVEALEALATEPAQPPHPAAGTADAGAGAEGEGPRDKEAGNSPLQPAAGAAGAGADVDGEGLSGEKEALGGEEAGPSLPAPARKSRRAAAEQASKNIFAWVSVGTRAAASAATRKEAAAAGPAPQQPNGGTEAQAAPASSRSVAGATKQGQQHKAGAAAAEEGAGAQRSPPPKAAAQKGTGKVQQPPAPKAANTAAEKGSKGQQSPGPKVGNAGEQKGVSKGQQQQPKATAAAQKDGAAKEASLPMPARVSERQKLRQQRIAEEALAQMQAAAAAIPPPPPAAAAETPLSPGPSKQQQALGAAGAAVGPAGASSNATTRVRLQRRKGPGAGAPEPQAEAFSAAAGAGPPAGPLARVQLPLSPKQQQQQPGAESTRPPADVAAPPAIRAAAPAGTLPSTSPAHPSAAPEATAQPQAAGQPQSLQQQPEGNAKAAAQAQHAQQALQQQPQHQQGGSPVQAPPPAQVTPEPKPGVQPQLIQQAQQQQQVLGAQGGPQAPAHLPVQAPPAPAAPEPAAQQQPQPASTEQKELQAPQAAAQQQGAGGGAGSAPAPAWTSDEDRLLIKTMLAAGGKLDAQQLEKLAAQVGGDALGRTLQAVEARCAEVFARFIQKMEERKRQQQQQ